MVRGSQRVDQYNNSVESELLLHPLGSLTQYTLVDNADWSGCDMGSDAVHAMGFSHFDQ